MTGYPHVEIVDGCAVVAGTPVRVARLFEWHRSGITCRTLAKRYPQLTPAQLFGALSWAYDHPNMMASELAKQRAEAEKKASEANGE